ncbi:MAG: NUDIX domain-containing protein [Caldilineaceae bacterium]|nr:NUDIX domain-containing protein [Caldilineaceae bacterium]MCB0122861.1 NUDIX domain-containing protein [Caldilineaceae bacterium]MCB0185664.1 NUDIX domain-containing protein [Caldilineaceae bacterium]
MARVEYGNRIGKDVPLRVGASALIFDERREKILLTRREDNGEWCLPGGALDAGESAEECCIREVYEEIGVRVEVVRLIGIYTSPHQIIVYADGNRYQVISFSFEAKIVEGTPALSPEVTEIAYFASGEIAQIPLMATHRLRIEDALHNQTAAMIR